MELTYQGLKIQIPLEDVVEIEAFELDALFNEHAVARLVLLAEEEKIGSMVHRIEDGDKIEVYEDSQGKILFVGKITDAKVQRKRGLCVLKLEAVSYTAEWALAPVSQSFLNLDATYKQVIDKVLDNQLNAEIQDCVTKGAVIPDFLLQYEESDWDFLVRLASHFHTFLIADCHAAHGRAYFGIPNLGEEYVLNEEEFTEIKDMDQYYRMSHHKEILPQETLRWVVRIRQHFFLAQRICFRGISVIVTGIRYRTVNGELVCSYELSREKGVLCAPKKNPNIFGMSIPATVKERSGNCVRVHFHIDREYDTSAHVKYFTYAIESSFIYCMPEVGSQVHIYFPGDDEKDAVAVHAIRATGGKSSERYAQVPENKSFSNVSGAELLMAPTVASVSADREKMTSISLNKKGDVIIKGTEISLYADKDLIIGEPVGEDSQPPERVLLEAGSLKLQISENGSRIDLMEEAKIVAVFIHLDASDRSLAGDPSLAELYELTTASDEAVRADINQNVADQLVQKYEEGRTQMMEGLAEVASVVGTVVVSVIIVVGSGGTAAPLVVTLLAGSATSAFAASDMGEGIENYENAQSGNLSEGRNYMLDDVFGGNEDLYNIVRGCTNFVFSIVSSYTIGSGIKTLAAKDEFAWLAKNASSIKMIVQTFGGVMNGVVDDLARTGEVNPVRAVWNLGIGIAQGSSGTGIRDGLLDALGINGCSFGGKALKIIVGAGIDTMIGEIGSRLSGQEYDRGRAFIINLFAVGIEVAIGDPVDAATGIYSIHATDFLLASLPAALKMERTYRSTNSNISVLGKGWDFPYASRIYRDTKDAEHIRIHLETITGHAVCFEEQSGVWVNQSKGASRFLMEVKETTEGPGYENYLLTDVMDHTLCVYDGQGLLQYVEYPGSQQLMFAYDQEGLKRITTPLGNVLEVECRAGRILQITDEIGRRNQYRYENDCLVDVIHADEGITHYEYDENGHITSVTDQNGSRYIENEYDEKGRVIRQSITGRLYMTVAYDDVNRRNTIYYKETGKIEIYEYNDCFLTERVIYDDGTCEALAYSDNNLKTCEINRLGFKKEWEYDAFGRTIREVSPDGYEVRREYDENHDLIRTWDTEGRETQYAYDNAHNQILIREKLDDKSWRETTKEYDSMGRCVIERDALGNETLKEYDSDHAYPSRITTPKGEETAYRYDIVGRRMSVSNSYGTVEMAYNSRNFVTSRTDGEGYTSHKFYDRMGNLTAYYPPLQWEKEEGGYEYRYDSLERLVDTISPLQEHQRVLRNVNGAIVNRIHPVSYTLKGDDGEGTRYEYDSDGNCIRIHYPDGGTERRFYDVGGNMVKQVQPESYDETVDDGAGYCYAYDACGRLTLVKDPEGNVLHTYEYNGHGQITREVDGEGKETLYTYNGLDWKIREEIKVRETGGEDTFQGEMAESRYRVISYSYDDQGNKVEEAYGKQEVKRGEEPVSWHSIHFTYDLNNHLIMVYDDFGAQMRYDYDCLGNVTLEERVIAEGIKSTVRYAYNKNGWRIQKTEEIQGNGAFNCAVTKYDYDANGNLTKIVTPKGFAIRREYDADDRLTEERITDRKSGIDRRVRYTYDEAGNVLKHIVLGADGECLETGACYDRKDRLICMTTPEGAVIRYFYDRNDKLSKAVSPYAYEPESDDGAGTTYAYDSRGNRIRVTNALGELVQESAYNLRDRPVMQRDAFGNRTELSYEADGQIKEVRRFGDVKWNGNAGDDTEQGATVDRSAGNGQRTLQQYEYNARGQIIGIVDGNRNSIAYDVDSWGRIIGIGFADGAGEGYEYTPVGQVSRTTDGNGNSVQYRYNSFGKVSERIDQMGYTETFRYDEEGNLSLHIDRDGRRLQRDCNVFGKPVYEKATDAEGKYPCISTWHYDSLGRVTRAVRDGHSYEYIYDEQGNLKEKRSSGRRLVSYTYDKAGQITEIKDPAGVSTRYEYDILGRKSRIYNDDGLEVRYNYDALNRISHIRYGNGVETVYAYDGDGNISSLETKAGEDILLSFAYQYDGNGNRTVKVGTQTSAALGGITAGNNALDISYHYDVRGQLLEERRNGASVCYAYDKAGNRIRETDSKGATIYQFNRKNQLITEESPVDIKQFTYDRQGGIVEEKSPAGIRRFSYDSRHRQTRVETENGSVQENRYDAEGLRFELLENGKRTSFVYHNGELLHEEGREEGQTSYHLGAGIDALQRGQDIFYCHRDEQLSTMFVTGREAVIQNSYQYDAFGAEAEVYEQFPNRIRYTGQQYDELTGQYYLRARYYDPLLGRFMQEDVYQGDGLNLYAYCNNNPIMYFDPSGYGIFSFLCPKDEINKGIEEDHNGPKTYYQVTSKESAQALMASDNPALRGGEFQEVYVWSEQPTYEQAINSGAYYPETVIQFESSASFIPDTSMDDKSLWDIAKKSARPGPISISNVIEVGFKKIKRWWQFWKK